MTELQAQAREMLARESLAVGGRASAELLRSGGFPAVSGHAATNAIVAALQSRDDEVERLRETAQQAVVALDHELNTLLDSVCLRDRNGAARRETAEEGALPDVERMEAALASLRAALNRTGGE